MERDKVETKRDEFQVESVEALTGCTPYAAAFAARFAALENRAAAAEQGRDERLLRIALLEGELNEARAAADAVLRRQAEFVELNHGLMAVFQATRTGGTLTMNFVDRLATLEFVQGE